MTWLLEASTMDRLERFAERVAISSENVGTFLREHAAPVAAAVPRNMRVAGDTAEIRVEGLLTPKPDLFAWLFGGGNTTYEQIQSAFALADSDAAIKKVSLFVNSPGGMADGLFETLAVIQGFTKPISVRASKATSAAYAIAATAGKITALTPAAEFGSIGVAASYLVLPEIVDIASTAAPKKRPNLATEEGKAITREYLDALHQLFAEAIAVARGVNVKTVNENFGQGAVLVAGDAKKRGMIDSIVKPVPARGARMDGEAPAHASGAPEAVPTRPFITRDQAAPPTQSDHPAADGGAQTKRKIMNEAELKAQHPELFAAVLKQGHEAGRVEGEATERDRVCAHLTMGEKCDSMPAALKAIREGTGMTMTLQAEYITSARNAGDRNARQEETDAAKQAVAGAEAAGAAAEAKAGPDLGDQVVALLDSRKVKAVG